MNAIFFFVLGWVTAIGITVSLLWDEYHPQPAKPQVSPNLINGEVALGGRDPWLISEPVPGDLLDYFEIVEVDGRPKVRWAW